MTCRVPTSRTTCYNGFFGDRTCHTTTDHPPIARTTCRPTLFGERCATRIIPGTRENTTCRTNIFGDTQCRTTYERPHSYWGPTHYTDWSSPGYRHTYTTYDDCIPCEGGPLSSFLLGITGIACLMAAFSR